MPDLGRGVRPTKMNGVGVLTPKRASRDVLETVAHGEDGPPGVLLGPGKTLTFEVMTSAPEIRVFAMVAPTVTKDHYLTTTFKFSESGDGMYSANLDRHDIGHDEESMEDMMTDNAFGTVAIKKIK